MDTNKLLFETDTAYGHYQVWETIYGGRPARVLYSGQRQTAQSGVALDGQPNLLFDYNQRMLELVSGLQPKRLLLIGGGAFTLPIALLAALPAIRLDVVELDGELQAISERFFGLRSDPRLRIVYSDGRRFLDHNDTPYDMILIDAFIQAETPSSLQSESAAEAYKRNLKPRGFAVQNAISAYSGPLAARFKRRLRAYEAVFDVVEIFPASVSLPLFMAQNLLVVAGRDKRQPFREYLRHAALPRD